MVWRQSLALRKNMPRCVFAPHWLSCWHQRLGLPFCACQRLSAQLILTITLKSNSILCNRLHHCISVCARLEIMWGKRSGFSCLYWVKYGIRLIHAGFACTWYICPNGVGGGVRGLQQIQVTHYIYINSNLYFKDILSIFPDHTCFRTLLFPPWSLKKYGNWIPM